MKGAYSRFRQWSRGRPFAGGVCLLLSAIFIALPSLNNFRIGDLILTVSTVSGVSTVVLAVVMALCGVAALLWLHARVAAGVAAMIVALVAFPAANFGGYLVGTLLGIVGASLVLAWRALPTGDSEATAASDTAASDTDVADADTLETDTVEVDTLAADTIELDADTIEMETVVDDRTTGVLAVDETIVGDGSAETPQESPRA